MLLYVIILFIIIIYFATQNCNIEHLLPTADNAADMCKQISSKADEITAHYGGAKGLIDSSLAFLSPNNYKTGDNTTQSMARNIINTDLSTEDITKINNQCNNSSITVQSNIIDLTDCEYCKNNQCIVSNVRQTNESELRQKCTVQSAIDTLLKKTNSVDAMALGQALQKSSGILSGSNKSVSDNCNIVSTDMSSKTYLESISKCVNESAVDQTNVLKSCGSINNVIQENRVSQMQDCLVTSGVVKQSSVDAITKATAQSKTDQTSLGVDTTTAMISSAVVSCSICIISVVLIGAGLAFSQTDAGKDALKSYK